MLTGHSLIAGSVVVGDERTFTAVSPLDGRSIGPAYTALSVAQLDAALDAARAAAPSFARLEPERHAAFLDAIAFRIDALGDVLIERAVAETGLSPSRVSGECARTTNQLRLFADVVRRGEHRGVRIDPALPERRPVPRPDIRQRKVPLGPVAVFGASNFPLAFSTAGGDTASALAAGCPVIVKAHGAHPGTGELVASAIADAVAEHALHPGVFSHVYGAGAAIGQALAAHPIVRAIGFTGSRAGGLALVRTAQSRPEPIPVYAEMSSVNPVFILPGALREDADGLAAGYLSSMTGSSGQLCTQPGLVFVPRGGAGDEFVDAMSRSVAAAAGQTMLTRAIADQWRDGVIAREGTGQARVRARGTDGGGGNAPGPVLHETGLDAFRREPALRDEIFGAASLIVRVEEEELIEAADGLEGQLTATIQLADSDHALAARLIAVLEQKAGRLVVNDWPTGVEVGHAMVHGGPFPATSDARWTSVGTLSIERFLRPVAYQGVPDALLPEPLQRSNPWGVPRRVDGSGGSEPRR